MLRVGGRSLLILFVAFVGVTLLRRLIDPVLRISIREQMSGEPELEVRKRIETLSHVVYRTAVAVVAILAVVMILPQFGVDVAPLIAGLGLVGLAVGFGAQNLVKDVINGMFILVENQYGRGDVVEIANISGLVEDINLRRTILRDLDGTVHFVPHSQILVASNLTKGYSRVNLNVRVAYETDVDHAIEVVNRIGLEMSKEPEYEGEDQGPTARPARRCPHGLGDRAEDHGRDGADRAVGHHGRASPPPQAGLRQRGHPHPPSCAGDSANGPDDRPERRRHEVARSRAL